jgi:hypothetical protein
MLKTATAIVALGLAAGGCTHLPSPSSTAQAVVREDLKDDAGHVIGTKAVTVSDAGERITLLSLFVPRLAEDGRIVGYEERVPGGTVLRDLNGKKIGGRLVDLRSRSSNPHNKGLTIVVLPREDRVRRAAAPSIEELIRLARLDD